MDNEQIIIDGIILNDVKDLLFTGQRSSITTSTFEKIIDLLEEKTQECEELKEKIKIYSEAFDNPEFRVALTDIQTGERDIRMQRDERLTKENERYRKALEEIEEMLQVIVKSNKVYPLQSNLYKILNIISKEKGEE